MPLPILIMPVIRQKPPRTEYPHLVRHFLARLAPRRDLVHQPAGLNLEKSKAYYARRELLATETSADLVAWSERWCSDDDWRRARSAVRSQQYKNRNDLARVSMARETQDLIARRANRLGLPIWKYLCSLDLDEDALADIERKSGLEHPVKHQQSSSSRIN